MRAFPILAIYLVTHILFAHESQAQTNSASCLNLIKHLEKQRDDVQSEGGVWGIFSKIPSLTPHSSTAIEVDSKISKLVSTLNYLCETSSGVPLNELAEYVSRKVEQLGVKDFKNLHHTLGKPEKEIEGWLVYTEIALANRKRILEFEEIKKSIQGARGLVNEYWTLFREFNNRNTVEPILSRTISLGQAIDEFFTSESYLALAIFEDSQVPFWDIDENYGGS